MLEDARSKSIVITIRGTASMMDAINDLSLDDEAFSVDVDQDPILRQDEKLDAPDKVKRINALTDGKLMKKFRKKLKIWMGKGTFLKA